MRDAGEVLADCRAVAAEIAEVEERRTVAYSRRGELWVEAREAGIPARDVIDASGVTRNTYDVQMHKLRKAEEASNG